MPMNFPDFRSLEELAEIRGYRKPNLGETEDKYREFIARSIETDPKYPDFIEAEEVRNKVGWDKWSDEQNRNMLRRRGLII